MHIFEIFKDIENCPPHLVSSNRKYALVFKVMQWCISEEYFPAVFWRKLMFSSWAVPTNSVAEAPS